MSATAALQSPAILATWRLDSAARQVVLDLRRTRMRALAEGVGHRLVFTEGGSEYRAERKSGRRYAGRETPIRLPTGVRLESCTARGDSISFQPRGHAGSFGTLTLVNDRGDHRQVVVDMVGRMRVL